MPKVQRSNIIRQNYLSLVSEFKGIAGTGLHLQREESGVKFRTSLLAVSCFYQLLGVVTLGQLKCVPKVTQF